MHHAGAKKLAISVILLDGKVQTVQCLVGVMEFESIQPRGDGVTDRPSSYRTPIISLCKSGMQDSNLQPPVSKTGNLTIDIIPALHLFFFQNVSPVKSEEIESPSLGPQPSALTAML